MKSLLIDKLRGNPKLLIIIFYLTKFIVSILGYRILKVENILKRYKIINTLAYEPCIKLTQKMRTKLIAFNINGIISLLFLIIHLKYYDADP